MSTDHNSGRLYRRTFTYTSLPESAIRLLTLKLGSLASEIRCTTQIYSPQTQSQAYNALSYCWGDAEDKLEIIVDDSKFRVTRNLKTALQHLRKETEDVVLWVDAICINQDDADEKSEQIYKMRNIYEEAKKVIIWLGPAADDSNRAMLYFQEKGQELEELDDCFASKILKESAYDTVSRTEAQTAYTAVAVMLNQLRDDLKKSSAMRYSVLPSEKLMRDFELMYEWLCIVKAAMIADNIASASSEDLCTSLDFISGQLEDFAKRDVPDGMDQKFLTQSATSIAKAKSIAKHARKVAAYARKIEKIEGAMIESSDKSLQRSIQAIIAREFWQRAWIVQEVLVARELDLVCGVLTANVDHAIALIKIFQRKFEALHLGRDTGEKNWYGYLWIYVTRTKWTDVSIRSDESMHWHLRSSHQSAHIVTRQSRTTPIYLAEQRPHVRTIRQDERWLLSTLIKLRHLRSTVPQDKILSLLGLLNDELASKFMKVLTLENLKISLTLFEVCASLPRVKDLPTIFWTVEDQTYIDSRAPLGILLCASEPFAGAEFPSWLPNFSRPSCLSPRKSLGPSWHVKTRKNNRPPEISQDGKVLSVTGAMCERIEESGITGDDDDPFAEDDLSLLARIRKFEQISERDKLDGKRSNKFWSCLVLWGDVLNAISSTEIEKGIVEKARCGIETNESEGLEFLARFRETSYGRRFARLNVKIQGYDPREQFWYFRDTKAVKAVETGEDTYAMVPADAKAGDVICVLDECHYPVILRSVSGKHGHYTFIGVCETDKRLQPLDFSITLKSLTRFHIR